MFLLFDTVASYLCVVDCSPQVLCLHGYRQDAKAFKTKTGGFRKILKNHFEFGKQAIIDESALFAYLF